MKKQWVIILHIFYIAVILGGYFAYQKYKVLPDAPETYYQIFNKSEILDGSETTASQIDAKLDERLARYQRTWEKITTTTDPQLNKALFYMNFVRFYGYYGPRTLNQNTLSDILYGGNYFQCGTFTTFLAMLLDKAGYQFRTLSVDTGNHSYVEVNIGGQWQILDPTTNTWINKSTDELQAGQERSIKKFYLRADNVSDARANANLPTLTALRDQMFNLGIRDKWKIDSYNYIDLSQFQY